MGRTACDCPSGCHPRHSSHPVAHAAARAGPDAPQPIGAGRAARPRDNPLLHQRIRAPLAVRRVQFLDPRSRPRLQPALQCVQAGSTAPCCHCPPARHRSDPAPRRPGPRPCWPTPRPPLRHAVQRPGDPQQARQLHPHERDVPAVGAGAGCGRAAGAGRRVPEAAVALAHPGLCERRAVSGSIAHRLRQHKGLAGFAGRPAQHGSRRRCGSWRHRSDVSGTRPQWPTCWASTSGGKSTWHRVVGKSVAAGRTCI